MKKLFLLIGCVVALSSCNKKAADKAANTENTANTEVVAETSAAAEEQVAEAAASAFDAAKAIAVNALGLHNKDGKWELMFMEGKDLKRIALADDVTIEANGATVDAAAITAELFKKADINYWLNEAGQVAHIVVK